MSYSPIGRRTRRRRTTTVAITAVALTAIAFGVSQSAGDREVTRQYLDIVYQVIADESEMSTGFRSMIEDIESFTRPRMVQTMDDLERIGGSSIDALLEASPPGNLEAANLYLRIAVTSWRAGLSEARAGLIALSANPVDEDGLAAVRRGFLDLRLGDRAYSNFLSEMTEIDTELHGGPPASISFIPPGQDALFDPVEISRRMLFSDDLTVVVDLAIADLRLDPPALGTQGGLPVVPASDQHFAEATVSNRGNIDQIEIQVNLRLVSGAGLLHEETVVIPELLIGRATTITFSALPVEPGTTYELTIWVPSGDAVADNDLVSLTFIVNLAE